MTEVAMQRKRDCDPDPRERDPRRPVNWREPAGAFGMTASIVALSSAQPLPLAANAVFCTTLVLINLIAHAHKLQRGAADIIRARDGR